MGPGASNGVQHGALKIGLRDQEKAEIKQGMFMASSHCPAPPLANTDGQLRSRTALPKMPPTGITDSKSGTTHSFAMLAAKQSNQSIGRRNEKG